jgi:hypothetical protein
VLFVGVFCGNDLCTLVCAYVLYGTVCLVTIFVCAYHFLLDFNISIFLYININYVISVKHSKYIFIALSVTWQHLSAFQYAIIRPSDRWLYF